LLKKIKTYLNTSVRLLHLGRTPKKSIGLSIPIITMEDMEEHLGNTPFLVSHGGISSEALTRKLDLNYSTALIGTKPRPFRGAFVHSPTPPPSGPRYGIYLYGQLYDSILSQLARHPDNPRKLKNNENYPLINSPSQLFAIGEKDPFGVQSQFYNYFNSTPKYPLIYVRREMLPRVYPKLASLVGAKDHTEWVDRARKSNWELLDEETKKQLHDEYGNLKNLMSTLPGLMIKYPPGHIHENDGIRSESVERTEGIDGLLIPSLEAAKILMPGLDVSGFDARLKHIISLSDGRYCVNLRLDILSGQHAIVSCISRIIIFSIEGGRLNKLSLQEVTHSDVVLGSGSAAKFVGFDDPRVIRHKDGDYIISNASVGGGSRKMFIYDVSLDRCAPIQTRNFQTNTKEKNWTPFIHEGSLHLLYSLNPLVVLKSIDGKPDLYECIKKDTQEDSVRIDYPWGSTPLLPWLPPYFVGFAHSRHPWRAVPFVYNSKELTIRFGSPFNIEQPEGAISWRGKSVQFPYDLELNEASVKLSVEFEDRFSAEVYLSFEDFCMEISRLISRDIS